VLRAAVHAVDTVPGSAIDDAAKLAGNANTHPPNVAPSAAVDALRGVDDVPDDLPVGRQSTVRTVASDAELQSTYDAFTTGATPFERSGYPGTWMRRADDVEIGLRTASRSGGRTIDIRFPDGTTRKIHIE